MDHAVGKIVRCPACGRTSPAPLSGLVFNCVFCGCRMDTSQVWVVAVNHAEGDIPLPGTGLGRIHLVLRWNRHSRFWPVVFVISAMLLIGSIWALTYPAANSEMTLAFSLLPVGVLMGYISLAKIVNRSDLRLDGLQLSLSHGPLPWLGEVQMPTARVDGFLYRRVRRRGSWQYQLWVETKDEKRMLLLDGLESHDTARFLQDRLHAYLRSLG